MKTKLKDIYIHITDKKQQVYNLNPIKTDLIPDGYNVYEGAYIKWRGKTYEVLERIKDIETIYLLVVKQVK